MTHVVEKDWTTKSGLRAVCLFVNESHRCGYVGVPVSHVLYGINYGQEVDFLNVGGALVGKKSPLLAITASVGAADGVIRKSPDVAIDVHGGLTYAGGNEEYPAESNNLWWFGFDCAHAGDGTMVLESHNIFDGPVGSLDFVIDECESMAEQFLNIDARGES